MKSILLGIITHCAYVVFICEDNTIFAQERRELQHSRSGRWVYPFGWTYGTKRVYWSYTLRNTSDLKALHEAGFTYEAILDAIKKADK